MEAMFETVNEEMGLKLQMKNVIIRRQQKAMGETGVEKLKMDGNEMTSLLLFET